MCLNLKEVLSNCKRNDPLRLKILTLAPRCWSINKVSQEFNVSWQLAKKAQDLKSSKGIFPDIEAKCYNNLDPIVFEKVQLFYEKDEISRILPGMNETLTVKRNGERVKEQKRLILFDLRETYSLFKCENEKLSIGFSTFAKLRPKYCVLAGASGTHSVCICTIHQNAKLMLQAINIEKLSSGLRQPISDYKDCLKLMTCENPSSKCHLSECDKCPSIDVLKDKLLNLLDINHIESVEYSYWTSTDRSTLSTVSTDALDFLNELCHQLEILKPHSFIAKQQSSFMSEKLNNLRENEVIVKFDFSQNYAYTCQNASQAFHFNNDQCTVFPVVYHYYQESELKYRSCIFLSSSLKHDTAAVYTVQSILIPEILKKVKKVKKIIYMTDGAKQHFKNKYQMANLLNHEKDFGIKAEWHFSATAHGKSSYDGIGAIFKREARRFSLIAKPAEAILSHEKLYKWAKNHFENIDIYSFSESDHNKMRRKLNKRFQDAEPVKGILKNHSFYVMKNQTLFYKRYSNSQNGTKLHE